MELRHLRYFVAVAEEKNFLRAATRLHISQPPLSTQIRDLEEELGAALLVRSPRGVELTAAGKIFFEEAKVILARVAHARLLTRRIATGEAGGLSVGFVSIADFGLLPPALKSFRAAYPDIELALHEMTTDMQVRELLGETIDVGIGLAPVDEPGLSYETLASDALVIAVPDDHRVAGTNGSLDLKELSGDPFVMVPRAFAPGLHDLIVGYCERAGFEPTTAQYAKQMQTVIGLVSSGLGVALVPASLKTMQRVGVTYLPIADPGPALEIGLLYRAADTNPIIPKFLQVAHEYARTHLP
jgi:DNA-binding transcriptional LysR family regulator